MSTPVKNKMRIWDMCLQLMQEYKEANPDIRVIIDSPLWRKLIFPNGVRVHFMATRRNSRFAICTLRDSNDDLVVRMDLFNEDDINTLRNRINKLL